MDVHNTSKIDTQVNIEQFRAELKLNDDQFKQLFFALSSILKPLIDDKNNRYQVLSNQLELIDLKNTTTVELTSAIESFKRQLDSIINDENIHCGVKEMILTGKIAESRTPLDLPSDIESVALKYNNEFARKEYVKYLRRRCGKYIRVFGNSQMNDLTSDTYIRQALMTTVDTGGGITKEKNASFQEVIASHSRFVVTGRAGRGKTSLLYFLAQDALDRLETDEKSLVPIYLPMEVLCKFRQINDLREWLANDLADPIVATWVWGEIQSGNVLLLLDALDEVRRDSIEGQVGRLELLNDRGVLFNLIARLESSEARIVLTCRDSIYNDRDLVERVTELGRSGGNPGFTKFELNCFSYDQIVDYVSRYFGCAPETEEFLKAISLAKTETNRAQRCTYIASEPLYLHMMCWLYATGNSHENGHMQLPGTEDDLWHQLVSRLLLQRDILKRAARGQVLLLEELAFHQRFCGRLLTRSFVEEIAAGLAASDVNGRRWLEDLEEWELLIYSNGPKGEVYSFPIPSLDEYFAACHLVSRWKANEKSYYPLMPRKASQAISRYPEQNHFCPNPSCRALWIKETMDWYYDPRHEPELLLLSSLLDDAQAECELLEYLEPYNHGYRFMWGKGTGFNWFLKVLSRCRHVQPKAIKYIESMPINDRNLSPRDMSDGYKAMAHARNIENAWGILGSLLKKIYIPMPVRGPNEEPRASNCGLVNLVLDMGELVFSRIEQLASDSEKDQRVATIVLIRDLYFQVLYFECRNSHTVTSALALTPTLVNALSDKYHRVRYYAADSVYHLVKLLRSSLRGKKGEENIYWGAAKSMVDLKTANRLNSLLKDPNEDVQALAHQICPITNPVLAEIKAFTSSQVKI